MLSVILKYYEIKKYFYIINKLYFSGWLPKLKKLDPHNLYFI
jgi:hypothetical protein